MTDHTSAATTLREVANNAPGAFVTLTKIIPAGSIQARKARDGVINLYWRFAVTQNGATRQIREPLGRYDSTRPPKSLEPLADRYSLAAAIKKAESLAAQHVAKRKDGGIFALRAAEASAKADAEAEARREAAMTLSILMRDYADHLERLGRNSHRDVRSITRAHIDTHAAVANKTARLVIPDDVADLMRHARESGFGRTANKLRSYLRAAYEVAKSARLDASVSAKFKGYNIKTNPAAETRVIDLSDGKPHTIRALSLEQLRAYWRIISKAEGSRGAVIRLHLLTGGQRPAQLMRLRVEDIQGDYITIYDGKGKTRALRPHAVPLVSAARVALKDATSMAGTYALTSDTGTTHINAETFTNWAVKIVREADPEGKLLPGFTPKLVRSGIETALAAAGVSKETRGRLQSHGISGVQDRHYNAHDYMPEKRRALETLHRLLAKKPYRVRHRENSA